MRLPLDYPLTASEIASALSLPGPKKERRFSAVTARASLVVSGDLFVALQGTRFDGHDFVSEALARGAGGLLISHHAPPGAAVTVFEVPNTEHALGELAAFYLQKHRVPVIGITGSVGKTSAKELIAEALSLRYTVKKTEENENNLIGISKTILARKQEEELLVLEMGTNHPGEILKSTTLSKPDLCILTALGRAHLGHFESEEALRHEKLSLLKGLAPNGLFLYNGDTLQEAEHRAALAVSLERKAPYRAEILEESAEGTDFLLTTPTLKRTCFLSGGKHRLYSLLFALGAAEYFGLRAEDCLPRLLHSQPKEGRGAPISVGGALILDDCYNASPESMAAALHHLSLATKGRRIAVLGGMKELGAHTSTLHREVGRLAASSADLCLFFGEQGPEYQAGATETGGAKIMLLPGFEETADALLHGIKPGDTVLVKSSHAEKGNEIVKRLTEHLK